MKKSQLSKPAMQSGKQAKYLEIANSLRQKIASGHLSADTRLPSTRNYAIESGVSRTTVVAAFEQLKAEGYLSARPGAGYFVMPMVKVEAGVSKRNRQTKQRAGNAGNYNREPHPGAADTRLFPYRQWARCINRVARENPQALIEPTAPFGDPQLRQSISQYLFDWRGIDVTPEQILVTAGSVDGLEICVRTLVENNKSIGLEDPGYLPLRNFATQAGLSPWWLEVDDNGATLPVAQLDGSGKSPTPGIVVITPSHQYPLGGAMSPARRMAFIEWARSTNGWIIEDDYDSEFRYAGKPIPALAGLDTTGRTIYIGSFSKTFSVGLRLGFVVMPEQLIGRFAGTIARFASRASVSMQRVLSVFMDTGEFYRHIRRARRTYGERRKALVRSLEQELGDIVTVDNSQAGMMLLAKLPDQYEDQTVATKALETGVIVGALSRHYTGTSKRNGLLIGFCGHNDEEIQLNVRKLAILLKRM